ncbi:MAG TPA: PRC-barrel domain-containing protein [Noviherbaspirillum sp.]
MPCVMFRNLRRTVFAILLAMPLAAPSFAQGTGDNAGGSPQVASRDAFDMRASQVIGKVARDSRGEDVGKIHDLLIDPDAGRAPYAIVALGGTLGAGDKLIAFPTNALGLTRDRGEMVLDVNAKQLKEWPGFSADAWPREGSGSYFEELRRAVGDAGKVNIPPAGATWRASELIGRNVDDREGRDAGEIQDIVVDISRGRVSYVVLDFDKAWSLSDKLIPLPMNALRIPRERDADLMLTLDRDRIDMARGFEQKAWPDLNEPAFRQNMSAYFLALERPTPAQAGNVRGQQQSERSSGSSD